jgi:hypothetical protein
MVSILGNSSLSPLSTDLRPGVHRRLIAPGQRFAYFGAAAFTVRRSDSACADGALYADGRENRRVF